MPPLKIEVYNQTHQVWQEAGTINPGDPYGSISDNTETGRDIYYFGVDLIEGKAVIKKSLAGIDIETGDSRVIHSLGDASLVASLEPGEKFELTVKTDQSNGQRKVRFTHLDE